VRSVNDFIRQDVADKLVAAGRPLEEAAQAIAQAEVVRGSFDAELLDEEALRIVKYPPNGGGSRSSSLRWLGTGAPLPAFLVGDNRATDRPGCLPLSTTVSIARTASALLAWQMR
jgi:hypothetical protein